MENCAIVLRHVGERTKNMTIGMIRRFADVIEVNEKPFFNAVKKMWEIGAKSDYEWIIGMDADILVVKGDPSANISDTRNIQHVFKQGKLIDRAAIKIE